MAVAICPLTCSTRTHHEQLLLSQHQWSGDRVGEEEPGGEVCRVTRVNALHVRLQDQQVCLHGCGEVVHIAGPCQGYHENLREQIGTESVEQLANSETF